MSKLILKIGGIQNVFFYSGESGNLPFDIFSAAFYLLSRYEEYLPHVKDNFGRFTKNDSISFKHDFLNQPVVDIWASYFKNELKNIFQVKSSQKKNIKLTQSLIYLWHITLSIKDCLEH